jgi:hypothetical protein
MSSLLLHTKKPSLYSMRFQHMSNSCCRAVIGVAGVAAYPGLVFYRRLIILTSDKIIKALLAASNFK